MGRVIFMCGPAGSGKSTVARQYERQGMTRLSFDQEAWSRGIVWVCLVIPLIYLYADWYISGKADDQLRIRIGIGVIFDQQVDFGGYRRLGIGDGAAGVAGIVEIEHVDRQGARRQFEAAPQIGTGEAEPLQGHTRRLVEIGEGDTVAPRLGPYWAETTGEQCGQKSPAPQHRP